jgi:ubiquinone/menaquinone biosynthesis C-methylase UbiE
MALLRAEILYLSMDLRFDAVKNPHVVEGRFPAQKGLVTIRDQGKALDNQKQFQERMALYRSYGHDREKAMRFICKQASLLSVPLLEIGCGKGITALELIRWVPSIISLDVSEVELSYARLNLLAFGMENKVRLVQGDAAFLPFLDNSFQAVFMVNALHHLPYPGSILREVVRVLNTDGCFVLADFTAEGFQIINRIHGLEEKDHHRYAHTIGDAVDQLTSLGLVLISQGQGHQEEVAVLLKAAHNP